MKKTPQRGQDPPLCLGCEDVFMYSSVAFHCPLHCRTAGMVDDGVAVVLEEDAKRVPCIGRVREGRCTWTDVCEEVGVCQAVADGAVEVTEEKQ